MSTTARRFVGLLLLALLAAGGFALLRGGVYGWTVFVMYPVFLGGLASWVFRPVTRAGAAGVGALAVTVALLSLLLIASEGLICIAMTMPLALPLGALGGWLVFHFEPSRMPTGTVAILLLLPPASMTCDTQARPPVFEVRSAIEIAA